MEGVVYYSSFLFYLLPAFGNIPYIVSISRSLVHRSLWRRCMHYVYILYSNKSDIYYVGISNDVELRLQFHNHISTSSFTSKHRPWTLEASISVPTQAHAIRVERYMQTHIVHRNIYSKMKLLGNQSSYCISLIPHTRQYDSFAKSLISADFHLSSRSSNAQSGLGEKAVSSFRESSATHALEKS